MQSSPTHVFYTNFQTYFPLSFTVSLFPGIGKIYLFTMTVWVTGLTHSVLLPMNVILAKECKESNSPTPRKLTFILDWNFFEQLWRHSRKLRSILIQSTVESRAKRMPDSTFETTVHLRKKELCRYPSIGHRPLCSIVTW